jgi:hypothetical protein
MADTPRDNEEGPARRVGMQGHCKILYKETTKGNLFASLLCAYCPAVCLKVDSPVMGSQDTVPDQVSMGIIAIAEPNSRKFKVSFELLVRTAVSPQ